MKKTTLLLPALLLAAAPVAHAGNVGVDLNINVGNQPRAVVVPAPPPTVVYQAPAPAPPPVVIEEPPMFIVPPALGFYAAVGVPYDLFFVSGNYYLCRNNVWYQGARYNGPWVPVAYRRLPPGLRRHRFEKIRRFRDDEYRVYQGGGERYAGRRFRPEKEWKERRKDEHERWKEEKREEREERRERRHHGEG